NLDGAPAHTCRQGQPQGRARALLERHGTADLTGSASLQPAAQTVTQPAVSGWLLQDDDRACSLVEAGNATAILGQRPLGILDLTRARLATQLGNEFRYHGQPRCSDRMAFADEPA